MVEEVDDLSVSMPVLIFPISRSFKNTVKVIGITLLLTYLIAAFTSIVVKFYQGTITEEAIPAKESEFGGFASILNLLYMLVLVFIITFLVLWLIRKRKVNVLKVVMTIAILYLIFTFTPFMISLYAVYLASIALTAGLVISPDLFVIVVYILAFGMTILFMAIYTLSVLRRKYFYSRDAILLIVGVWTAVWLSWNFGEITPLVVLVGFSLYDLYSVLKGPLRELSHELTNYEKKAELEDRGIMLGLGDIFFYSFAIGYSFAFLNLFEILIIMLTIAIGVMVTIYILINFEAEALPALPIPILAAVALILIFKFI